MISLPFAFLASLLLGMRHATDPDHVIAVTTIVARQRSASGAAIELWQAYGGFPLVPDEMLKHWGAGDDRGEQDALTACQGQ